MQKHATIAIEGPNASHALDELLAIPGLEANRLTPAPKVVYRDAGVLSAIGEIISAAGGVVAIVSSVLEWRKKWLEGRGSQLMTAVIEDARGNRLLLKNATPEQLTEVFGSFLAAKPE
jgi:hypothetical protein